MNAQRMPSEAVQTRRRYRYFDARMSYDIARSRRAAAEYGVSRLKPKLSNPDYLVLTGRLEIIRRFAESLEVSKLRVLDVGGRIQPYRSLFESKLESYVSIDPQIEGETDIVAWGEALPFASETFDLVLCLQVLSYSRRPSLCVSEAHRVLKPGGAAVVSAPALFPEHHDENWRFLPGGIEELFAAWSHIGIYPECHNAGGAIRTVNVCLNQVHSRVLRACCRRGLIPALNYLGRMFESHHRGGQMLCPNYTAVAFK